MLLLVALNGGPALTGQEVDYQSDQAKAEDHTKDQGPIVFHKPQHALAIKHRQDALGVITQRARHQDRYQKSPSRKLQSARGGHENLERHRRWQDGRYRQGQNAKPSIPTFDALNMVGTKAPMQNRLASPPQN